MTPHQLGQRARQKQAAIAEGPSLFSGQDFDGGGQNRGRPGGGRSGFTQVPDLQGGFDRGPDLGQLSDQGPQLGSSPELERARSISNMDVSDPGQWDGWQQQAQTNLSETDLPQQNPLGRPMTTNAEPPKH